MLTGSTCIVLVLSDTLSDVFGLPGIQLLHLLDDIFVDSDTVHPSYDVALGLVRMPLHPRVAPDLLNGPAHLRVGTKNVGEQISSGLGDPLWQLVDTLQNLFLEAADIGVLEREPTA